MGKLDLAALRKVVRSLGLDIPDSELQVAVMGQQWDCGVACEWIEHIAHMLHSAAQGLLHTSLKCEHTHICHTRFVPAHLQASSCVGMQDMITEFDTDRDGMISETEFMAIVTSSDDM